MALAVASPFPSVLVAAIGASPSSASSACRTLLAIQVKIGVSRKV